MKNYGLPYQGSKNLIAKKIIDFLPPAENFYDLFAGGCAITHAAMESGKYKNIIFNDIQPAITELFLNAVQGKYKNETRWISREDFLELKEKDAYVKYCWSFGNDGDSYLCSTEIEPYKKACHYAIVFDEWELLQKLCPEVADAAKDALKGKTKTKQRRLAFGPAIVKKLKEINDWNLIQQNPLYNSTHKKKIENFSKDLLTQSDDCASLPFGRGLPKETLRDMQSLQSLQSLESLERLERLQSLESLESLERWRKGALSLTRLNVSYDEVEIKPNSIIYCDIPYKGTRGYNGDKKGIGFDYEKFYAWAEKQTELVFISEYKMP